MRYYKHLDFPEVMVGNSDIVAVIENPHQLQRVIDEHNALLDQIESLKGEIEGVRNYKDSIDRLWRKAVCERTDLKSQLDKAAEAIEFTLVSIGNQKFLLGSVASLTVAQERLNEVLDNIRGKNE